MSLYGQGSFLRMFILEQVVQPGGARSVEGEGYIRLQARNGVQQIPLEIPQIDGCLLYTSIPVLKWIYDSSYLLGCVFAFVIYSALCKRQDR